LTSVNHILCSICQQCRIYDWSVVSLKKGHLLVSITAYLEVSVCLFRRGLAIDPAILNKRYTAAEDGSAVLYLINTNLPDGM